MKTSRIEEIKEKALDLLHECVQHTPLKIEETKGTEYDRGYIFYQDMVVQDVLNNTPKLKTLITEAHQAGRDEAVEETEKKYSPLREIVKQFYNNAREYEEYTLLAEVDAMAFQRDTGMWPPGKSAPAEMYLEPIEDRQKAFNEWCKKVDTLIGYNQALEDTIKALQDNK